MSEEPDETIERVHFDQKVLTFKRILSDSSSSDGKRNAINERLYRWDVEKNEYIFSLTQFQDETSIKEKEDKAISTLSQTFQTSNIKGNLKVFSLFSDFNDFNSPQVQALIVEMLEQNGFNSVELIGRGAYGLVFKAKNTIRNEIVALKIQILIGEQSENELIEEGNLAKYLSRRVADSFKSKALSIYSKIVIQDLKSKRRISILEMELAKCSLRDIIQEKRLTGSEFTRHELKKICSDLLENLFYIHVNNVAHFDIKPDNVLYLSLNDSYILADFGVSAEMKNLSTDEKIETELKGTPLYMSPIMKESYFNCKPLVLHNPFKSDIYSLGLIFLEMVTVKALSQSEFKELIFKCDSSSTLADLIHKHPLYINCRYTYIVGKQFYQLPNLLELMIDQDEKKRKSIAELCLVCDLEECILSQVLTPFSDIFRPVISNCSEGGSDKSGSLSKRKTVQRTIKYVTRPVIYEGACVLLSEPGTDERLERNGFGVLFRLNKKTKNPRKNISGSPNSLGQTDFEDEEEKVIIYEGNWKNDLPDGQGYLLVAETGYTYKGDFKEGRLHGVGSIFHQGKLLRSGEWFANISNEFQKDPEEWIKGLSLGLYKLKFDRLGRTVVKFFKIQGNRIIFDVCDAQGPCRDSIIQLFTLLGKRFIFTKAVYKRDYEFRIFRNYNCDMLLLTCQDTLSKAQDFCLSFLARKSVIKETKTLKKDTTISTGNNFGLSGGAVNAERSLIVELLLSGACCCLKSLHIYTKDLPEESFKEILSSQNLSQISSLFLNKCEKLNDSSFHSISFSLLAPNLSVLDFLGLRIDDEGLRIMSSSKSCLKLVTCLKLARCSHITDKGIKYLTQSENFKNLRTLSLESTLVTCRAAEDIASSKHLKNLTKLNFCHCIRMGDQGLKTIFNSENFRNVKILNIGFTHFSDAVFVALGSSKYAGAIESLNIMRMRKLTKDALFAMFCANKALSNSLMKLKTRRLPTSVMCLKKVFSLGLWISMNSLSFSKSEKINDECIQTICNDSPMTNLEYLTLSFTKITDLSIKYLAESKVVRNLKTLHLTSCPGLKDTSIAVFLNSENGSCLENLKLNKNNFTDAALFALSGLKKARPNLKTLRIKMCKSISDSGLEFILRADKFPSLSYLDLSQHNITNKVIQMIGESCFAENLTKLVLRQSKLPLLGLSIIQLCDLVNHAKIKLGNCSAVTPAMFTVDVRGNEFDCSLVRQELLKNGKLQFLENILIIEHGGESNLRFYINQEKEGKKQQEGKANNEITPFVRNSSTASMTSLAKSESGVGAGVGVGVGVSSKESKEVVNDEVLKSLANSQCLRNLTHLNLAKCGKISDLGLGLIFNSELCRGIRKIDLSETNLTDNSLKVLTSSKYLQEISELYLTGCEGFTLDGLLILMKSEKIAEYIKVLDIRVRIPPQDADRALTTLTQPLTDLKSLHSILLDFSGLQFKILSFQKAWANIERLLGLECLTADFSRCSLNENHCELIGQALQKLPALKSLTLNLSESNLRPESTKILAKALHSLSFNYLNLNLKTSLFWKTIRRKQKKEFETVIKRLTNGDNQIRVFDGFSTIICQAPTSYALTIFEIYTSGIPMTDLTRLLFRMTLGLNFGDSLYVAGDSRELGNWNVLNALRLEWHENDVWSTSINMSITRIKRIEYIYFIASTEDPSVIKSWERGPNRTAEIKIGENCLDERWERYCFCIKIYVPKNLLPCKEVYLQFKKKEFGDWSSYKTLVPSKSHEEGKNWTSDFYFKKTNKKIFLLFSVKRRCPKTGVETIEITRDGEFSIDFRYLKCLGFLSGGDHLSLSGSKFLFSRNFQDEFSTYRFNQNIMIGPLPKRIYEWDQVARDCKTIVVSAGTILEGRTQEDVRNEYSERTIHDMVFAISSRGNHKPSRPSIDHKSLRSLRIVNFNYEQKNNILSSTELFSQTLNSLLKPDKNQCIYLTWDKNKGFLLNALAEYISIEKNINKNVAREKVKRYTMLKSLSDET